MKKKPHNYSHDRAARYTVHFPALSPGHGGLRTIRDPQTGRVLAKICNANGCRPDDPKGHHYQNRYEQALKYVNLESF